MFDTSGLPVVEGFTLQAMQMRKLEKLEKQTIKPIKRKDEVTTMGIFEA